MFGKTYVWLDSVGGKSEKYAFCYLDELAHHNSAGSNQSQLISLISSPLCLVLISETLERWNAGVRTTEIQGERREQR